MKGISSEIKNFRLEAAAFEDLFYELDVAWVNLVGAFGFDGIQDEVQADLIGLIHDQVGAWNHFAHMIMDDTRDVFEIGVAPGDEIFKGVGFGGIDLEGDAAEAFPLTSRRCHE